MIDDPVQSMDPARVDGLATVLAAVAEKRQVVVFTHDDRLAESVRRLDLPARYVDHVDDLVAPVQRERGGGELALRLVVGSPTVTPLVGAGGDLDNYLFPYAPPWSRPVRFCLGDQAPRSIHHRDRFCQGCHQ